MQPSRCSTWCLTWATAIALCCTGQVLRSQEAGSAVDSHQFSLKAPPQFAAAVNAVLAELGEPVELDVPAGWSVQEAMQRLCGDVSFPSVEEIAGPQGTRLRFRPCLRFKTNAELTASNGDTLGGLAYRLGLRGDTAAWKIESGNGETDSAPATQTKLSGGERLIVPAIPVWTRVRVSAKRSVFVQKLATSAKCPTKRVAAEDCLLENNILVVDGAHPPRMAVAEAAGKNRLNEIPDSGPKPVPSAKPTIPVDPAQWPYDVQFVADMLKSLDDYSIPVTVGVADIGLRDRLGAPMDPAIFSRGRDLPADNWIDDDGNEYVDDVYGAGVPYEREAQGTGNLSACASGSLDLTNWSPSAIREASHGSVVAAVAAATALRMKGVARFVPSVVYYRVGPSTCAATSELRPGLNDFAEAVDYLAQRAKVMVLSYSSDTAGAILPLSNAIRQQLNDREKALVIPAGHPPPGDLDVNPLCLPCVGQLDGLRKKVFAVGAAGRDLKISPTSNFGRNAVTIYAPGVAVGTRNLDGAASDLQHEGTSIAAPHVALGVALLHALGLDDLQAIRDRLTAATWPVDGELAVNGIAKGVMDLTKVAAVRHDAVEVIETLNGERVRHTYVGEIAGDAVQVCSSLAVKRASAHAARISHEGTQKNRAITMFKRLERPGIQNGRGTETKSCQPEGSLSFKTLDGQQRQFAMTDVAMIQFRWN